MCIPATPITPMLSRKISLETPPNNTTKRFRVYMLHLPRLYTCEQLHVFCGISIISKYMSHHIRKLNEIIPSCLPETKIALEDNPTCLFEMLSFQVPTHPKHHKSLDPRWRVVVFPSKTDMFSRRLGILKMLDYV